jgi:hypothetical protein
MIPHYLFKVCDDHRDGRPEVMAEIGEEAQLGAVDAPPLGFQPQAAPAESANVQYVDDDEQQRQYAENNHER